jgi:hypothetical protein
LEVSSSTGSSLRDNDWGLDCFQGPNGALDEQFIDYDTLSLQQTATSIPPVSSSSASCPFTSSGPYIDCPELYPSFSTDSHPSFPSFDPSSPRFLLRDLTSAEAEFLDSYPLPHLSIASGESSQSLSAAATQDHSPSGQQFIDSLEFSTDDTAVYAGLDPILEQIAQTSSIGAPFAISVSRGYI